MTFLALDLGSRRVGVAISHGFMAEALRVIELDKNGTTGLIEKLRIIVSIQKVEKLVVGLPLSLDGKPTEQSQKIKAEAEEISKSLGLSLDFTPEALTSWEAEGGVKQGEALDSEAARIILEQYLNERGRQNI